MDHKHEYETILRPELFAELREHGLEAVEIRKCTKCHEQMPFVLVRGKWLALFIEHNGSAKDILMA